MKRAILAVSAAAAIWACNAPMIPLPPPAAEDLVVEAPADAPDFLVFRAAPEPGRASSFPPRSRIELLNLDCDRGVIVIADDEGRFETDPVCGAFGDRFHVSYDDPDGAESETLCLVVQPHEADGGRQSPQDACDAAQ